MFVAFKMLVAVAIATVNACNISREDAEMDIELLRVSDRICAEQGCDFPSPF